MSQNQKKEEEDFTWTDSDTGQSNPRNSNSEDVITGPSNTDKETQEKSSTPKFAK